MRDPRLKPQDAEFATLASKDLKIAILKFSRLWTPNASLICKSSRL